MKTGRRLLVILGNQLFEPRHLGSPAHTVLFLAAMRHYADELRAAGFEVCYREWLDDEDSSYERSLATALRDYPARAWNTSRSKTGPWRSASSASPPARESGAANCHRRCSCARARPSASSHPAAGAC
jgi:deoxyribodipyrimidine photolyase-like uncharacterized protein